MAQIDDLQNYVNENMPLRAILFRWDNVNVAYDGNPNAVAAPPILGGSPPGTIYLESSGRRWLRHTGGVWTPNYPNTQLEEAIELTVSATGTDPDQGSLTVTTQAAADVWGDFATIAGAVAAVPDYFNEFMAVVRLPAGLWIIDPTQLGDLTRFRPTDNGWLRLAGDDSWIQTLGTPVSMAVVSNVGSVVTLAADPGLTPNAFKGYYLLVLSGTGAGQFKPIRSHSGTSVTVARGFGPALDATSVVRISERATTLQMDQLELFAQGDQQHSFLNTLELWGLNIVEKPGSFYWWVTSRDCTIIVDGGTRFVRGGFYSGTTNVILGDCVMDGDGYGFSVIFIQAGMVRTNFGSSRPMLLIGDNTAGQSAITVGTSGGAGGNLISIVYLFGGQCFDGWDRSYIELRYPSALGHIEASGGSHLLSDQGADYAVLLRNGANFNVKDLALLAASTFTGTLGDFSLDDTVTDTWANLNAAPDKVLSSTRQSSIMEDI